MYFIIERRHNADVSTWIYENFQGINFYMKDISRSRDGLYYTSPFMAVWVDPWTAEDFDVQFKLVFSDRIFETRSPLEFGEPN